MRLLAGEAASVANPTDLAGAPDQDPGVFVRALEILLDDPSVGGVLVSGLFGGYHIRFDKSLVDAETTAALALVERAAANGKPVVMHTLYGSTPSVPLDALRQAKLPVLRSLEIACRSVAALHERATLRRRPSSLLAAPRPVSPPLASPAIPHRLLPEPEARDLVASFGIPLVPAVFCRTAEEVREAARRTGGEVVLKAVSPHLAHKSEAGGVRLSIRDADAAARAFHEVLHDVRRHLTARGAPADVSGVLISPMLARPIAELLVGVRRDPQFGLVLVVGTGGLGVEVADDVAVRLLPASEDTVRAALDELRIAPVLRGHRGHSGVNPGAVVALALSLAKCVEGHPEIIEMELNPVFAYDDRAVGVDVRAYRQESA
jgi:acetyltransferase